MKVYDRLDLQYYKYENEYNKSIINALRSGSYILGEQVRIFEHKFANLMGSKYCVGLNSGLDALILSLRILNIKKGDEVIVQTNTFIATVMAITENSATPIFVEPDEFHNIDVSKIEEKITAKTKAIIVVHLYGQATNMDNILYLKKKYNLYLIEDCAQAHTAKYLNKNVGTFGDIGCFSFYPTKNLGAFGDGGAIITDNQDIYESFLKIRNYGSSIKYINEIEGVNSRLDELQAALLNVKIDHLNELTQERINIAELYLQKIKNKNLSLPTQRNNCSHVFHLFVILTKYRDELKQYLDNNGIKTQIHYPIPPHLQKCYNYLGYKTGDFPISEYYAKSVISLPLYNGMTIKEIDYVIDVVNNFSPKEY